jgi:hypothetical protein
MADGEGGGRRSGWRGGARGGKSTIAQHTALSRKFAEFNATSSGLVGIVDTLRSELEQAESGGCRSFLWRVTPSMC